MVEKLIQEKAIQIENITFSYDSIENVLENFSLSIAGNEFVAMCGQNGSGKTTLLKIITGLLRQSAGDIYIHGKDSRTMSAADISAEIGFVMQNPDRQLFADTVFAEAAYALKNQKLAESEIIRLVEDALVVTGLSHVRDSFPHALSRGERARLVFASVLAMHPKTIILDEPSTGQDHRSLYRFMDIAQELHRQGHTIIFVTHNMSLAARYARRVVVMGGKGIIADGTPEEIFCRSAEIAGIVPPEITRLSMELRKEMPLPRNALTPEELAAMLLVPNS